MLIFIIPGFIFLFIGLMAAISPRKAVYCCNLLTEEDKKRINIRAFGQKVKYTSFITGAIQFIGGYLIHSHIKDSDVLVILLFILAIFGEIIIVTIYINRLLNSQLEDSDHQK